MEKKMLFYQVSFETSSNMSFDDLTNEPITSIKRNVFAQCKKLLDSKEPYTNTNYTTGDRNETSKFRYIGIQSIDRRKGYVFGILGRTSKVADIPFQRVYEEKNPDQIMGNLLLDDYSYFMIVFRKSKIIFCHLDNSRAPKVQALFSSFFSEACKDLPHIAKFRLAPFLDRKIINKLKRAVELQGINFKFAADAEMDEQIKSLKDMFNLSQSDEINVSAVLTLKGIPIEKGFIEKVTAPKFIKSFKRLKVKIEDSGNHAETLDLIENLLSKSVHIEIPDDENSSRAALAIIENRMCETIKGMEF